MPFLTAQRDVPAASPDVLRGTGRAGITRDGGATATTAGVLPTAAQDVSAPTAAAAPAGAFYPRAEAIHHMFADAPNPSTGAHKFAALPGTTASS